MPKNKHWTQETGTNKHKNKQTRKSKQDKTNMGRKINEQVQGGKQGKPNKQRKQTQYQNKHVPTKQTGLNTH